MYELTWDFRHFFAPHKKKGDGQLSMKNGDINGVLPVGFWKTVFFFFVFRNVGKSIEKNISTNQVFRCASQVLAIFAMDFKPTNSKLGTSDIMKRT